MDMTGEYRIPAPRQQVWEALNNPEILRAAIPGCESIEKLSDTEMTAKVAAKVGPVSAKFSGKVTLSDLDPPNGYRISGEGSGGAAGFAKGGATVTLADDGAGGTILSYKVDAQIGGKLAQIGSRLIDGVSRKMADDFFARFSAAVGGASAAPPGAAFAPAEEILPAAAPAPAITIGDPVTRGAAAVQPPTPGIAPQPQTFTAPIPPSPATSSGPRLPPWLWIGGLIVIVIIILAIFA
ncbi:MAG TPA: carbon monoxide dehydrogenase subunit G [Stellaceae bacterium]|nr:carbon monoxide dehydrogenase subunit G [Stellaceae bacterium]